MWKIEKSIYSMSINIMPVAAFVYLTWMSLVICRIVPWFSVSMPPFTCVRQITFFLKKKKIFFLNWTTTMNPPQCIEPPTTGDCVPGNCSCMHCCRPTSSPASHSLPQCAHQIVCQIAMVVPACGSRAASMHCPFFFQKFLKFIKKIKKNFFFWIFIGKLFFWHNIRCSCSSAIGCFAFRCWNSLGRWCHQLKKCRKQILCPKLFNFFV